jgi:virginiamycin B lyase
MIIRRTAVAAVAFLAAVARAQAPAALSGQVSSAEEGTMEGVVVSAKRDGSTITVSVVSDAKGRFAFPAERLEPGHYTLKARAAGYELDSARAEEVAAGTEAKADVRLRKAKNLAGQLTNAEWLTSMPGTVEQKRFLLNCNGCHSYERIMKS